MNRLRARLLILVCLIQAVAQAEPVPIDAVIAPGGMLTAALSPDTKHVAAIVYNGTNYGLILMDTATREVVPLSMSGKYVTTSHYRYFKAPRWVRWAANDILVVDYGVEVESMDLKGKRIAGLGEHTISVIDPLNNPDMVLASPDVRAGDLSMCNARTGKCRGISRPSGKPIRWAIDRKGELRAISVSNSAFFSDVTTITNWYRPDSGSSWIRLAEFKITDDYWLPVYVPDEPGQLVISSRQGRETYALFNYDVKLGRTTEMLAGHPSQDIVSWDGIDENAFRYVATSGMKPQQVWFDSGWLKMQLQVDALLPNRINRLSGDPEKGVLIYSSGDVEPGTWYFFDLAKRTLATIGKVKPELDTASLLPMEIMSYTAADGLSIPAYLTRSPHTSGPGPVVVLIHGGPIARDEWEFNPEVQILASRGYTVFQPQFRGSAGFGRSFEQAGYRQWGRAMQDDITAGVEYLISKGVADRQRICIVGASYGGYAALWGLIKTPSLYRCGVSFAGVSDIANMFSDWSDRTFRKESRQMMLSRIGEKDRDAAFLDAVSPLKHASKVVAPVLLMHGEDDVRVPISHSKKMRDALERSGKRVEWLTFENEGHGLEYIKNQHRYYTTLLDFLDKHLSSQPGGKDQAGAK